jgi:transglutaminase-like putative cysteine protease
MTRSPAPTYSMQQIPDGADGIRATLKSMSHIVKAYKTAPAIFELTRQLTRDLRQKDIYGEAKRVHQFVRDKIRYVKDIRGVETLQTPIQTLRIGQGDCDDKSTLVATMLETLGHQTRFKAVGFGDDGSFSHVFPQVKMNGKWITLETTEPWPIGRNPKKVKNVMTQHN